MNRETEPTNGKTLELPEYESKRRSPGDLPTGLGDHIYENYDAEIAVEFPSPKTDGQWEFTNRGYAGRVQLPNGWKLTRPS